MPSWAITFREKTVLTKPFRHILPLLIIVAVISGCDGTKYVAENELLLSSNKIVSEQPDVSVAGLSDYLLQRTNTKWFSSLKIPLGIYSMSGQDTTKRVNRWLRKWGEAPVILDTLKIDESITNLTSVMQNKGYLDATVKADISAVNKRARVTYKIEPRERYLVRHTGYDIMDREIDSLLRVNEVTGRMLKGGEPFSINTLHNERNNITSWLNNNGYYYFNKDAITYMADSSKHDKTVDVMLRLGLFRNSVHEEYRSHPRYKIRNVSYEPIPSQKLKLRKSTLNANNLITAGDYYSSKNVQDTYNRFSRLKAIRSTNIHFTEIPDSNLLDVRIQINRRKPNIIQIQPEGTNTSGDFGAALSLTYENVNIFHGSEQLSVQARGAYEAIHGLEGYENNNYEEFGVQAKLMLPKYILPGLSSAFHRRHDSSTEFSISYNRQNRPEFHRRVLTGSWRYKWNGVSNNRVSYHYDLIDVNYISMPWISETFKRDYLESENTRNMILRYNYENLLIMKMGFGFNYTDSRNSLRTNIETAGNLLYGMANLFNFSKNDDGQYKFALIAFAQYVKTDIDYTHLTTLDDRNALVLHARVGVALPYGNSNILPFEKRYFSGGANSVRGWNVRTLGPGNYIGTDRRIDIINQTGDIKIDLNAELRTKLFWKFQGALFIDAGNIWTIKKYSDQPGGEFKLKSIYDEIAVGYGVGLRLNFDYFILRLDLGMKAVDPAYTTSKEHFPILHTKFSRDYALHFAVGMPF